MIADIVRLPQASMPVAGTVYNVDYALGKSGIIGIKTGSGLNSGANFLFAASADVDSHAVTLFGCVMGQPTLDRAFAVAQALIGAMKPGLSVRRVLSRNEAVAGYDPPWGGHADLLSTYDVDFVEWPGMILRQRLDAPALVIDSPLPAGTREGSLHMVLGAYAFDIPLVTSASLDPPGKRWRLIRIG